MLRNIAKPAFGHEQQRENAGFRDPGVTKRYDWGRDRGGKGVFCEIHRETRTGAIADFPVENGLQPVDNLWMTVGKPALNMKFCKICRPFAELKPAKNAVILVRKGIAHLLGQLKSSLERHIPGECDIVLLNYFSGL